MREGVAAPKTVTMQITNDPIDLSEPLEESPTPSRAEATIRAYDRNTRKRIIIAVSVSLVVNAIIFGYAGRAGHQFILALRRMEEEGSTVNIQRVILKHAPANGPDFAPGARPSSAPNATSEGGAAPASPSVQTHP